MRGAAHDHERILAGPDGVLGFADGAHDVRVLPERGHVRADRDPQRQVLLHDVDPRLHH
jgi:hypothetical protein